MAKQKVFIVRNNTSDDLNKLNALLVQGWKVLRVDTSRSEMCAYFSYVLEDSSNEE